MSNKIDPEEALEDAKWGLRMSKMYRRGWLLSLLICAPAGLYLIPVAGTAAGGTGKAYGLLCFTLIVAGMISAIGVMVQTFASIPESRQIVDRRQREYNRHIVREAGL